MGKLYVLLLQEFCLYFHDLFGLFISHKNLSLCISKVLASKLLNSKLASDVCFGSRILLLCNSSESSEAMDDSAQGEGIMKKCKQEEYIHIFLFYF